MGEAAYDLFSIGANAVTPPPELLDGLHRLSLSEPICPVVDWPAIITAVTASVWRWHRAHATDETSDLFESALANSVTSTPAV
jgi:hypothetical protein